MMMKLLIKSKMSGMFGTGGGAAGGGGGGGGGVVGGWGVFLFMFVRPDV